MEANELPSREREDAGHDRRLGDEGQVRGADVGDVGAGAAGPSHRDGRSLIGPRSSSATAASTKAPPANAPAQSASSSTVAPMTAPTSRLPAAHRIGATQKAATAHGAPPIALSGAVSTTIMMPPNPAARRTHDAADTRDSDQPAQ